MLVSLEVMDRRHKFGTMRRLMGKSSLNKKENSRTIVHRNVLKDVETIERDSRVALTRKQRVTTGQPRCAQLEGEMTQTWQMLKKMTEKGW